MDDSSHIPLARGLEPAESAGQMPRVSIANTSREADLFRDLDMPTLARALIARTVLDLGTVEDADARAWLFGDDVAEDRELWCAIADVIPATLQAVVRYIESRPPGEGPSLRQLAANLNAARIDHSDWDTWGS